ncbi:alanine dehydrogenase, partial [Bacillus sp. MYb56]
KGYKEACLGNTALLKGINTLDGYVTFEAVAEAHSLQYADAKELLEKAPALS